MTIIPLRTDTVTTETILADLAASVDDVWPVLDDDPALDPDQRAEVTRKFEEIEELVNDTRKIIGVSSENE